MALYFNLKLAAKIVRGTKVLNKIVVPNTRTFHKSCPIMSIGGGIELKELVHILESYAPTSLAEDWDNVGLLVEPSSPHQVRKVFLTNDLTEEVLDEAVKKSADFVLSYHPPIFRSIKRITQGNWKDRIVIKAIENRIAVYSPHTSYDALSGGVNDWLISCFGGDVRPIKPNVDVPENGVGRICKLTNPLPLNEVIGKVKQHLQLSHIRLASPNSSQETMISSIASCAGSGASVLNDVDADLYLTGEMSHHEVLHAVSTKRTVLLCEHSNTERGFLKVLKKKLESMVDDKVEILVSELDKDPLVVI